MKTAVERIIFFIAAVNKANATEAYVNKKAKLFYETPFQWPMSNLNILIESRHATSYLMAIVMFAVSATILEKYDLNLDF